MTIPQQEVQKPPCSIGTIVYDRGVNNRKEAFLGIVIREEVWKDRVQVENPEVYQSYQRVMATPPKLSIACLRILGRKVLPTPFKRIKGDPASQSIVRFHFRQENILKPLWVFDSTSPDTSLDKLQSLLASLEMFESMARDDEYLASVAQDLEALCIYLEYRYDLYSDGYSWYQKDLFRCFEKEIPQDLLQNKSVTT